MLEPQDVKEEKHVKQVLTVNGYKKRSFQIPKRKVSEEDQQTEGATVNKYLYASPTSLVCQNSYKECLGPTAYHLTTNLSTP